MFETLTELFFDLMTDLRWFRRILIGALAVLLLWLGAHVNWFVLLAVVLAVFEGADYLFRSKRDRRGGA